MCPDDDVPVPEPVPPVNDPRAPAPPKPPSVPPDEEDGSTPPPIELPGRGGVPERVRRAAREVRLSRA
ncbi:hypothetical protein ACT80S_13060 [Ramlibacter sp. MAHUQ-53]|uniref:hypothetical protein n=1 Tax=unclassified Ramlibacter TaxID=2617605 RepID=UPI003643B987